MTAATTSPATVDGDAYSDATARRLARIVADLEAVDFDRDMPTMSTYEVAAIAARLKEARRAIESGPDP